LSLWPSPPGRLGADPLSSPATNEVMPPPLKQ
jgi:hypothetical protein